MLAMNKTSAAEPVLKNLDRLIPDLEALYKDVHAHPELSMQETAVSTNFRSTIVRCSRRLSTRR
jgi:metal-dependent amidase/aminoacylase/carboxypeptidase family protein